MTTVWNSRAFPFDYDWSSLPVCFCKCALISSWSRLSTVSRFSSMVFELLFSHPIWCCPPSEMTRKAIPSECESIGLTLLHPISRKERRKIKATASRPDCHSNKTRTTKYTTNVLGLMAHGIRSVDLDFQLEYALYCLQFDRRRPRRAYWAHVTFFTCSSLD